MNIVFDGYQSRNRISFKVSIASKSCASALSILSQPSYASPLHSESLNKNRSHLF